MCMMCECLLISRCLSMLLFVVLESERDPYKHRSKHERSRPRDPPSQRHHFSLSLFRPMSFPSISLCWTCFPPVKHDSQITCIQTSYLPCKQI
ncbi:hypothetical protein M431DRAFT_505024 [Trichoderma harzianum CBS 226.95]|uniref:Secreted protein n=1 Tax=Trichoderma harzianum CBS 226.95 TaxID=983964 RepID=A0A2T4AK93_TRIHA|nr:hypothetical protein M431DRAFT_505024 [Trichoderma harzianum CBS 226.95]PTB57467.1 hypothetical protein M431DRAFT_505024 [Trichoderma harzianum CBS 226.95]